MISLDNAIIIKVCNESISMVKACKELNVSYGWLKQKATELKCWVPNKGGKGTNKFPKGHLVKKKFSLDDWNNDVNISIARCALRKWIIKENLLPYICANGCGNTHLGKPLTLDLDHINGKGKDNRKSNLRFLCPNCHSQTETFRNKER